ncbi:diguanylate cyclase (GGDEF)-like protein [Thermosipho japonicus]|uniref:Diguanylate cyclase (GGDEF)-like protein n=1 Tax=Thermosipho japonicus TaxID=90323 RepID=A0A841GSQ1_9BACT|nr:sensor domain-containing diguanylate cyclase [Thermosipho japonicus]MBB6062688.1 diguanylate cyclase (GGDEF)-like protein [Thermosipho japonicus]
MSICIVVLVTVIALLLVYIFRILKLIKIIYRTAKKNSNIIIWKNSKILYYDKSLIELFKKHGINLNDFKDYSKEKINFYIKNYPFIQDFLERLNQNFEEELFEYETLFSFPNEFYKIKFRRERHKHSTYSALLIINLSSDINKYIDELINSIYKIPEEFFKLTTSDKSTYEFVDSFFRFLYQKNIIDSLAVGIKQIDGSINIIYGKIGNKKFRNYIIKDKTLTSYIIDTGKKLYVKNSEEIDLPKAYKLIKIIDKPYSIYGIPLKIEDSIFGAVLFEKEGINNFTLKDIHLFEILSFLISINLKLKKEYEILYENNKKNIEKSYLDPLTKAYNRNYLYEILPKEIKSTKKREKITIVFLDLDNFKYINDKFGHIYGDKILINFVKTAKKVLRNNDIIIRYGGDEFLILLLGSSIQDSKNIIKRIKKMIYKSEYIVDFSYGLMYLDPKKSLEENIKVVDRKMYEMKNRKKKI